MNTRAIVTVVLAVALIAVVMGVAWFMTGTGESYGRFSQSQVWAQATLSDAQSMKIIDLTGDGKDDLFLQSTDAVAVYAADGTEIFRRAFGAPLATTMGDVNGDGVEDIVVHTPGTVTVLRGDGEQLWAFPVTDLAAPSRVAVMRFPAGPQIVLGDTQGALLSLSVEGVERWRSQVGAGDYIRTLDDGKAASVPVLLVANHDGTVAALGEDGVHQWTNSLGGPLRRLRAFDLNGDGTSEVLIGGDSGTLQMLDARDGALLAERQLGDTIVEVREAELDGDPSGREYVVGGKEGGVWALGTEGAALWAKTVGARVYGIAGIDVDDDGAEEVVVGDEGGGVTVFEGMTGAANNVASLPASVSRLDGGKLTDSDQVAVAYGDQTALMTLHKTTAPGWYSPLIGGLVLAVIIVVVAGIIATLPGKKPTTIKAEDQSVESLLAHRLMLHESLADVERLRQAGEMPTNAYLARLKELRGELADTEAALLRSGAKVQAETFLCPNCGGTLVLGEDKCDYCGQVVIT